MTHFTPYDVNYVGTCHYNSVEEIMVYRDLNYRVISVDLENCSLMVERHNDVYVVLAYKIIKIA